MRGKKTGSILLLSLLSWGISNSFAEPVADPCAGFLSLVNRPSILDSACVVPFEKGVIEYGAQYQNTQGGAHAYNLPEAELRLGLPANTELTIFLPNYNHQTQAPRAGFSASVIGLKHQLGYTEKWLGAVEGLVTLSSTSSGYGSDAMGGKVNGIVTYSINSAWSLTFMLGASTQTEPYAAGGGRFNSINPDLLLAWQLNSKFQTFAEVYGQSKTAPNNGAGFNADAGLQYLFTKNLEGDLELGQRISGQLGSFNNYIGAGMAWLF